MKLNALNRLGFVGQHTKLGDVVSNSINNITLKADANNVIKGGTVTFNNGRTADITIVKE